MRGRINRHACIIFVPREGPRPWGFRGKFGDIIHQPRGPFRSNDAEQIRAAVIAGLGLAHTPGWLFANEIATGVVNRVLREYEPADLPISVIYPGVRRLASKVRVFMEFLAEAFANDSSFATR